MPISLNRLRWTLSLTLTTHLYKKLCTSIATKHWHLIYSYVLYNVRIQLATNIFSNIETNSRWSLEIRPIPKGLCGSVHSQHESLSRASVAFAVRKSLVRAVLGNSALEPVRLEGGHLLDPAEERRHACIHAGPVGHCAQTHCAMLEAVQMDN